MKTKKKIKKEFRSPHVGFSLGLTTCRGGIHDERPSRIGRTRGQVKRAWFKDQHS